MGIIEGGGYNVVTVAATVSDAAPLKNCPWCKSDRISLGYQGQPGNRFWATCLHCGACGPWDHTPNLVFKLWSAREES